MGDTDQGRELVRILPAYCTMSALRFHILRRKSVLIKGRGLVWRHLRRAKIGSGNLQPQRGNLKNPLQVKRYVISMAIEIEHTLILISS